MTIPPTNLPPVAVAAYQNLTDDQKVVFAAHYDKRKRNMGLMVALSILLPIQLFLLGKIGLGILFILTGGGLGVWYVIEWFLTPGRVRAYNTGVAGEALNLIGSGAALQAQTIAEEEE